MNNPVKLLFGSLIGAGIGVAVSKVVESRQAPGMAAAGRTEPGAAAHSFAAGAQDASTGETFKDRLARARAAGDEARARKEAELRGLFREKVRRTDALTDTPVEN
jgi:hypothetical protein